MSISIAKGNSPTLTYVVVGTLELAFSYTTVVAFRTGSAPWIKSENVWSKTTGKHLNEIPGERISHERWKAMLDDLLSDLKKILG